MTTSVRAAFLFLLLFSFDTIAAIGVLSEVEGDVQILRGDAYYEGVAGVELDEQDIIETADNASVQLDMNDGSILKIAGGSRIMLFDYKLDEDDNVISAAVDVLTGWLRFVVSKLKIDGKYEFNNAVMTVGIRGTEGIIEAGREQGALHLLEGRVIASQRGSETGLANKAEVLTAGQFISRGQGQDFARAGGAPAKFASRMPPRMQHRLTRRAHRLAKRGLKPRQIRRVMRRDVKRYLNNNPGMKSRLWRRFQQRWKSDPEFQGMVKAKARKFSKKHPAAAKRMKRKAIRRKMMQKRRMRQHR